MEDRIIDILDNQIKQVKKAESSQKRDQMLMALEVSRRLLLEREAVINEQAALIDELSFYTSKFTQYVEYVNKLCAGFSIVSMWKRGVKNTDTALEDMDLGRLVTVCKKDAEMYSKDSKTSFFAVMKGLILKHNIGNGSQRIEKRNLQTSGATGGAKEKQG